MIIHNLGFSASGAPKRALACLVLVALAINMPANADDGPRITTFDAPGAGTSAGDGTYVADIAPDGTITGYYLNGINANGMPVSQSFVRTPDGTITTFDIAAGVSQGPQAYSINSKGAVVGTYIDAAFVSHGFLRTPDGTITAIDVPAAGAVAGLGTLALDINAQGVIAGLYFDANGGHAFLRDAHGNFTTVDVAGASGGTQPCLIACLADNGLLAGSYFDANSVGHGFIRDGRGVITTFDVPAAGTGPGQGTLPQAINPSGATIGVYIDSNQVNHGFARTPQGAITTFDVPGASPGPGFLQGTFPSDLNPNGTTVGTFYDAMFAAHGFIRSKRGHIATFDVPGAGTAMFQGTSAVSNNPANAIVGSYVDSNGVAHGFVRSGDE